jgi:chaperonin GroEL (HSP60 family)
MSPSQRWRNHHERADVQHPAAKMLVEVAKAQDKVVGDGTTTAVVLTGELLSKAEGLLDKNVHPTVIIEGYKKASEKAQEVLDKLGMPIKLTDEKTLQDVAVTSLSSKGISNAKQIFAKMAVDAVKQVAEEADGKLKADIDLIKIVKKHGKSLEETELVKGMVIDKEVSNSQCQSWWTAQKSPCSTRSLRSRKPSSTPKSTLKALTR